MINGKTGAMLKEERLKAGMTQGELADKLGYDSVQFVSLYERGLSKVPPFVIGKCIKIFKLHPRVVMQPTIDAFKAEFLKEVNAGFKSVQQKKGKK